MDYYFDSELGVLKIEGTGDMQDDASYGRNTGAVMYPWTTTEILLKTKKVILSPGITNIAKYAFRQSRLEQVEIPDTVTTISSSAFTQSNLTRIKIPLGVEKIGSYAFSSCRLLKEVYLPLSLRKLEEGIFSYCNALTDIYYAGSEEDWNRIEIEDKSINAKKTTIHFGVC